MAAQKQVPIAAPPAVPAAPAPPPASGAGTAGGGVLAHTSPEPGELPFTGPSSRPNEPLTAGLPQGPGPGPEALTGIGAMAARSAPQDTATKLLATLAMQPTAGSQLRDIARIAAITGH